MNSFVFIIDKVRFSTDYARRIIGKYVIPLVLWQGFSSDSEGNMYDVVVKWCMMIVWRAFVYRVCMGVSSYVILYEDVDAHDEDKAGFFVCMVVYVQDKTKNMGDTNSFNGMQLQ